MLHTVFCKYFVYFIIEKYKNKKGLPVEDPFSIYLFLYSGQHSAEHLVPSCLAMQKSFLCK